MNKLLKISFFLLTFTITSQTASAESNKEALHSALATIDMSIKLVALIGYQSIDQPQPDEFGVSKYIILDFRPDGHHHLQEEEMVVAVSTICSQITSNRPLIYNLSALGYDMVSVAFDDHSQFDCL